MTSAAPLSDAFLACDKTTWKTHGQVWPQATITTRLRPCARTSLRVVIPSSLSRLASSCDPLLRERRRGARISRLRRGNQTFLIQLRRHMGGEGKSRIIATTVRVLSRDRDSRASILTVFRAPFRSGAVRDPECPRVSLTGNATMRPPTNR
jgi:hypothetical protein